MYKFKYETLLFRTVEEKIYPDKQLVSVFLISDHLMEMNCVEVRPLTIDHLVYALVRNFTSVPTPLYS